MQDTPNIFKVAIAGDRISSKESLMIENALKSGLYTGIMVFSYGGVNSNWTPPEGSSNIWIDEFIEPEEFNLYADDPVFLDPCRDDDFKALRFAFKDYEEFITERKAMDGLLNRSNNPEWRSKPRQKHSGFG